MASLSLTRDPASEEVAARKNRTLIALVLLAGLALFVVPTMIFVVREGWSREEGAHGPIVLATGLWLLWQRWRVARDFVAPSSLGLTVALLAVFIPATMFARVTQIVELEGYFMYACVLAILYSAVGAEAMRRMWFPLFYLLFVFPPPDTVLAALTVPIKMWLSATAIDFLQLFGYPIAGEGVRIYVGQYELLVAAACSGINSIISLSAISLFYIYIRHQAEWRYSMLLVLLIVPIAIVANFFRVIILILLTYHAGEAAAQGFLHNFAGIVMFAIALVTIFALDELLKPIFNRFFPPKPATGQKGASHA